MKHIVPLSNWTTALADLIEKTQDGDVIIVPTEGAKRLAERAKERMCPDKKITFEIETD